MPQTFSQQNSCFAPVTKAAERIREELYLKSYISTFLPNWTIGTKVTKLFDRKQLFLKKIMNNRQHSAILTTYLKIFIEYL